MHYIFVTGIWSAQQIRYDLNNEILWLIDKQVRGLGDLWSEGKVQKLEVSCVETTFPEILDSEEAENKNHKFSAERCKVSDIKFISARTVSDFKCKQDHSESI